MTSACFIAGDWGTTAARFWLCDDEGRVLDVRNGTGVARIAGSTVIAEAFDTVCAGWPNVPAVLCGMVGSNIGWCDAGYVPAPVPLSALGRTATRFMHGDRHIAILPGVRCINPFDEADIMRGEETQIAGACAIEGLSDGIFALPGTHNKWVRVSGGTLERFHTAISGELFAALLGQSVLVARDSDAPRGGDAFDAGARLSLDHGATNLLGLLFATRVRLVDGRLPASDTASFLSGLVIGADVAGALPHLGDEPLPVRLICSDALAANYGQVLAMASREALRMSGADCARRGLQMAFHAMA